eukprot:12642375-Alexandrium_andersonii.AAC.1
MALYGAAVSAVSGKALAGLRSQVAFAIDQRLSKHRALDAVFALTHPKDVDPEAHVMALRAVTFRRMWHQHPECRASMDASFAALRAAEHPGCLGATNVLVDGDGVMTSGPEASEQGQRGPIALLLHSLARCNMQ